MRSIEFVSQACMLFDFLVFHIAMLRIASQYYETEIFSSDPHPQAFNIILLSASDLPMVKVKVR